MCIWYINPDRICHWTICQVGYDIERNQFRKNCFRPLNCIVMLDWIVWNRTVLEYINVTCRCEYSGCCWQIHWLDWITGMSSCPQVLRIAGCWWQLHPAEDNINKVIIGISSWPMDVVEFGDGGKCVRSQKWAWASSQWGTKNITNRKQSETLA